MDKLFDRREKLIRKYFDMWLKKEDADLRSIFDDNIEYFESYGPVYKGINQIEKWFSDWQGRAEVFRWDIKNFIHQNSYTAVEWYFDYQYDNVRGKFDGVTIFEFNNDGKFISVKEFQSKCEHNYPYGE